MASVELKGLTKWYGKRRGVEDLSLNIADKEFVAIFGPAGAGKTTTLNLIAGIVTPNRGSVKIAGRDIDGLEPADRNVAMVFESYALYPQLSVFDNMAFPLRSPKFKLPEDQVKERVTQYARVMKIDHLVDRQITALSNGQRQRVALGRALVRKPDIFLLDEPLSHLDAKLRHSMRAELKEMRSQLGTTTLYVTHDYLEAMSLADRILVINEGRTQQIGTPKEIYFRPASTLVAHLFGDPDVNLVDATLKSTNTEQNWNYKFSLKTFRYRYLQMSRKYCRRTAKKRFASVFVRQTSASYRTVIRMRFMELCTVSSHWGRSRY